MERRQEELSPEAEEAHEFSEQLDRVLGRPAPERLRRPIWPDPDDDPWSIDLPEVLRYEDFARDGNGHHAAPQQQDQKSAKSRPRGGETTPPSQA